MKAIKITSENQDMLAARYLIEKWEYDERMPLGYYLVTDFGNEETYELVSQETFDNLFVKTSDISNGFISIERK